jgi:alkanesulfonate monooxygenase SsuD/methylene tetrahydromethanopterin reductase-like flavin-dependent oxidoreductase (luciferase family)
MKFGLIFELQVPKPWSARSEYDIFHQAADQVVFAEQNGFEYAWVVEHHFLTEFAHSCGPEVWLGSLAARTSTIRLGHGVVLMEGKVNHPIRVAERLASLDIMSNGRADLGTGRSSNPWQLDPFGVDLAETREEWEEAVDIIPKMWMNDWFSHKGKFWDIPERNILPKPVQKPHPPIWMACAQPESFTIAGQHGIGALCFAIAPPGYLKERIGDYRKAVASPAKQVGAYRHEQVGAFAMTYCDENDAKARELGGPNALWYFATNKKLYDPSWQRIDEKDVPPSYRYHKLNVTPADSAMQSKQTDYNEQINTGAYCIGDPDACIRTIDLYQAAGADQILCMMQVGRIPHEKLMNSIRLFGKYVIPHFKAKARRRGS